MDLQRILWGLIFILHTTLFTCIWIYGPRKVDDTMTIYLWKFIRWYRRLRKSQ